MIENPKYKNRAQKTPGITWRSIILGALLIPPNSYWIMYVEGIYHRGHPTAISLFWNVVFTILVLVVLNLLVKRIAPRWALTQAEFVTIYVMITLSSALAGHDSLQLGIPALSHVTQFATPENRWGEIFRLPKWLTVGDKSAVESFYRGGDTFYRPEYIHAWLGPVLWWTLFIIVLGGVLICINVILRKQWTENERLSYPIVQLPLAITESGGNTSFFRNRMLWAGIAIGGGIDLLNGLHLLYPNLPYINVRHDARDLGQSFTVHPWNNIGWMPLPLYPFIIAMGFLLPLDLSFSVWFFYLFRKAQLVLLGVFPAPQYPRMPYFGQQSFGAWFIYCAFALYTARGHLKGVWRRAIGRKQDVADDSEEPVSYRTALIAIIFGLGFLFVFTLKAGMGWAVILPFFLIYLMLSIGIARMRAELGPPAHEMANGMDAGNIIGTIVGTKALGAGTLSIFPLMWWFTGRGYRTNIAPGQLEGFKMAAVARASPRRLGWAMLLALGLGGLAAFWAALHLQYQIGEQPGGMVPHNWGQFIDHANKIENPTGPDWPGIAFMGIGAAFTVFLFAMRQLFIWWPFHPAGYALSMAFGVDYFWSCLVISSILKWAVQRWGGLRAYRQILPLVYGVVLGEYCVGAFWSAMSVVLRMFTYDFAPG